MIIGVTTSVYIGRGSASDGPRAPTAPAFTAANAADPGYLTLTVTSLPSNWGDLSVRNDGFGTPGSIVWWNEVDGWQQLVAPPATGARDVQIPIELQGGEPFFVKVAGLSAAGRRGSASAVRIEEFAPGGISGSAIPATGITAGGPGVIPPV